MNSIMIRKNRMSPRLYNGMWDHDFFDGLFNDDLPAMPAVNVSEKENAFCIDMSVPGFDKDDINVEIDKNRLTISAKSKNENEEKGADDKIIRREFFSSSFERSFILPENIDTEKIDAKQKNGVLRISLPKRVNAPEETVKKIAVN